MKALVGSSKGEEKTFSEHFLKLLKERTGLEKADLQYCEFSLYPAFTPKYVGLDKSMIGSYG